MFFCKENLVSCSPFLTELGVLVAILYTDAGRLPVVGFDCDSSPGCFKVMDRSKTPQKTSVRPVFLEGFRKRCCPNVGLRFIDGSVFS